MLTDHDRKMDRVCIVETVLVFCFVFLFSHGKQDFQALSGHLAHLHSLRKMRNVDLAVFAL